jgi:hypothetical protein
MLLQEDPDPQPFPFQFDFSSLKVACISPLIVDDPNYHFMLYLPLKD